MRDTSEVTQIESGAQVHRASSQVSLYGKYTWQVHISVACSKAHARSESCDFNFSLHSGFLNIKTTHLGLGFVNLKKTLNAKAFGDSLVGFQMMFDLQVRAFGFLTLNPKP